MQPDRIVRAYNEFRSADPLRKFWFTVPDLMQLTARLSIVRACRRWSAAARRCRAAIALPFAVAIAAAIEDASTHAAPQRS